MATGNGRMSVWSFFKYFEERNISVCRQHKLRGGQTIVCGTNFPGRPVESMEEHLRRYHPAQFDQMNSSDEEPGRKKRRAEKNPQRQQPPANDSEALGKIQSDVTFILHQLSRVVQNLHVDLCDCQSCTERLAQPSLAQLQRHPINRVESISLSPTGSVVIVGQEERDPIDEFIAVSVKAELDPNRITVQEETNTFPLDYTAFFNQPAGEVEDVSSAVRAIVAEQSDAEANRFRDLTNVANVTNVTSTAQTPAVVVQKSAAARAKRTGRVAKTSSTASATWKRDEISVKKAKAKRKSTIFTSMSAIMNRERRRQAERKRLNKAASSSSSGSSSSGDNVPLQRYVRSSSGESSLPSDHSGYTAVEGKKKHSKKYKPKAPKPKAITPLPPGVVVITVGHLDPNIRLNEMTLKPGFKEVVVLSRLDPELVSHIERNGGCTMAEFLESTDMPINTAAPAPLQYLLDTPVKDPLRRLMNFCSDPLFGATHNDHNSQSDSSPNQLPIVSFSPIPDEDVVEAQVNSEMQDIYDCLDRSIEKICTEQDSSLVETEESESIPLPIVEDISEPNESSAEEPQMEAFLERPISIHIDRGGPIEEGVGEPMQLSDEVIFEENLALADSFAMGEEVEINADMSTTSGETTVSEADDIYAGLTPMVEGPVNPQVIDKILVPLKATEHDGFQLDRSVLEK